MTARQRAEQRRSVATVDRILDAAIAIIEQEGEPAVSVSRIVDRTGLSRGAVYHHFAHRDEVVRAAQFERLERQPTGDIAALRNAVRDAANRDEFIGAVALITAALCNPARHSVRRLRAVVIASMAEHPDEHRAVTALESAVAHDLTDVVAEGQRRGFITRTVDAASIAVVIEAVSFGLLIAASIEPPPTSEHLAAAVQRALLGFLPDAQETDTVSVL